ncbi:hypothetical protein FVP43_10385, partial [Lactococcus sp. dk322]
MKHKFWTATSLSFILLNALASPMAYAEAITSSQTTQTQTNSTEEMPTTSAADTTSQATETDGGSQSEHTEQSATEIPSETPTNTSAEASSQKVETQVATVEARNIVANAITTTISAPSTYQTYTDPVSNVKPGELRLDLSVSISEPNLEGAKIEVPYTGFMPTEDTTNFQYFTMTEPLFSYIEETDAIPEGSIVDHYENDTTNKKLIIHLKKTTQTVETLQLRFKYNEAYDAKIPAGQIIWNNIQATIKDSSSTAVGKSNVTSVKTSAKDGFSTVFGSNRPPETFNSNFKYLTYLVNNYNLYSLLDATKDNRFYLEVPEGTEISLISGLDLSNITPTTALQDPSIPTGYVRYYKALYDNNDSFSSWNIYGDTNSNQTAINYTLTPPPTLAYGDTIHVLSGMIYTKINGKQQEVYLSHDTTKVELKSWDLSYEQTNYHSSGTPSNPPLVKSDIPNGIGNKTVQFGGNTSDYTGTNGLRNQGKLNITNVSETLMQPQSGSKKINFHEIDIVMMAKDEETTKNYYRIKYIIKKVDGSSREAYSQIQSFTGLSNNIVMDLPTLGTGEYIDQATVQPMGGDGNQEGVLLPGNAFMVKYRAKNWPDLKWPDRTPIPQERTIPVTMSGSYSYNDEQGSVVTKSIRTFDTYYVPSNTTQASASFVSGNATNRKPGETVNYEIQGVNGTQALTSWNNPVVTVAIPKQLEMVNPGEMKNYVDKVGSESENGVVKVELLSSDAAYNYYRFTAEGKNAQKNSTNVSFSIP